LTVRTFKKHLTVYAFVKKKYSATNCEKKKLMTHAKKTRVHWQVDGTSTCGKKFVAA